MAHLATPAPREGPAIRRITELALAGLVGTLIGVATFVGQTHLDPPWSVLVNSASPWLCGAFLAGALQRRWPAGVLSGLGACVLEVGAFYFVAFAHGAEANGRVVVFWTLCAFAGGPLFGWAGWAWRHARGAVKVWAAAFPAATFLGEAIGGYVVRFPHLAEAALYGSIGIALFGLLVLPLRRHATALFALVALGAAGVVIFGPVLAVAYGSAVGP